MPGPEDNQVTPSPESLPPPPPTEGGTDNPAAMTTSTLTTSTTVDVERADPPLPSPPPKQPPNEQGCCKNRSLLEKCLFVFLLLIFLLFVAFLIGFVILYFWKSEPRKYCTDASCVDATARINKFIDRKINPCDDFYQYACGGWLQGSLIPDDKPEVTIYSEIETEVKTILKKLLEADNRRTEQAPVHKVRDFYASCTNTERLDSLGLKPLTKLAESVGKWPSVDAAWNDTDFELSEALVKVSRVRALHLLPFLSVDIKPDFKDEKVYAVYVGQGHLDRHGLHKAHKETSEVQHQEGIRLDPDGLKSFRQMLVNLLTELGVDKVTAVQDAKDVVVFKLQLANISLSKNQQENTFYDETTLAELEKRYPDFDWTNFLNGAVQFGPAPPQVTSTDRIIVTATPYLDKLFPLLNKTSDRVKANYLLSTSLWAHAAHLSDQFSRLLDDYNKEMKGQSRKSRWEMCVELSDKLFPEVTGRLFVQSSFGKEQRDSIGYLVSSLKAVLVDILRKADWMSDESKKEALEKAQALRAVIGYPDYVMDDVYLNEKFAKYNVSKEAFFQNMLNIASTHNWEKVSNFRQAVGEQNTWPFSAATVKAYYDNRKNQLIFPAGFVQAPVYGASYPRSMNYGGFGSFVGREMTHGFDEIGGHFGKKGQEKLWWTPDDKENFQKKAECMVDHYSCFRWKPAHMNINGSRTLGENIADNGGLKQSFRAYRNWVDRNGIEERLLPGLNLTHNQLFFISFAQLWCTNDRDEFLVHKIQTDSFAPAPFRVLGTLQNSEDFSRAFNCPTGSRMNPEKKCKVW